MLAWVGIIEGTAAEREGEASKAKEGKRRRTLNSCFGSFLRPGLSVGRLGIHCTTCKIQERLSEAAHNPPQGQPQQQ